MSADATSPVLLTAEIPGRGYLAEVTMVGHVVEKPYRVAYRANGQDSVSWHGALDVAARAALKWIAKRYPVE